MNCLKVDMILFLSLFAQANSDDETAKDLAVVMFETATLRSGYAVPDSAGFAERIEKMLRHALDIDLDLKVGCQLVTSFFLAICRVSTKFI